MKNYLQKLLDLRGITAFEIAEATGANYHSIQKTIKGTRVVKTVKPVIANYLDIDEARAWGPKSAAYLRSLVEKEVTKKAVQERKKLERRYLCQRSQSVSEHKAASNA
jgi:predicted transcriptional regulator